MQDTAENFNSELVIGLVCAAGTEINLVIDLLRERFGLAGYSNIAVVKVSKDVIPLLTDVPDHFDDPYSRYDHLMTAGNTCRANGENGILAMGIATVISGLRSKANPALEDGKSNQPLEPTVYIIDSLKRPEEVEELRRVYSSGFVLIGVHAAEDRRLHHLTQHVGIEEANARALLERDGEEKKVKNGQRVNGTFHLADFFVRISDDHGRLRHDLQRIVELMFGNPFITPSVDEHAMFMAFAAALRSADLSRQVGAVICKNSQILATGSNDCPKAGGGLYWPIDNPGDESKSEDGFGCAADEPDGRDYMRGDDSNRTEQLRIIDRIIEDAKSKSVEIDEGTLRELLDSSGIKDLTEYGRVVHAEMEAIMSCARNGISTQGATIYCTTYPCHNCAKHIVASGINDVVYVEPYPKSRARELHGDAIEVDSLQTAKKVLFKPFVGVGPRRFIELFSMNLGWSYALIRKDKRTGERKKWFINDATSRIQMKPASYLDLEKSASVTFGAQMLRAGEQD